MGHVDGDDNNFNCRNWNGPLYTVKGLEMGGLIKSIKQNIGGFDQKL